jgi:class 3 adenylate cyclase
MAFVNEIGEIVHNIVDQFSGAPNKNIGDAFLLVWKFDDQDIERDSNDIWLKDTNAVHQLADMSVISFLKILAMIKRSRKLIKYRENK